MLPLIDVSLLRHFASLLPPSPRCRFSIAADIDDAFADNAMPSFFIIDILAALWSPSAIVVVRRQLIFAFIA